MAPIDSSIPRSGRLAPFNNPFSALIAMEEGKQQRAAQQQEAQIRQQQIAQSQQRLSQEQAKIDEGAAQRFSAKEIHDAAEQAYKEINGGNAEAVLSLLKPESRVLAESWLGEVAKAKQDRDAQGIALGKRTAAFIQANNYDPVTSATSLRLLADIHPGAKDALDHVSDPVAFRKLIDHFATLGDKPEADFTLGPGQTRFGPNGQPVAAVPADVKPVVEAKVGTLEDYVERYAAGKGKTPKQLSPYDIRLAKGEFEAAGRAPTVAAQEPLVPIIGPDGQSVLVPRSQAVGKRPASSREQGRPVTSGDAGDLANYQTSLDDLKTLRTALTETKDATGFGAQVTAAIPYLPSAARNRQAVIDRVKQVIGKTLEGGVLRKEDEAKYEKILPTIKDPPSVAAAKIDGLEKAIALRNQRKIEALADAGYDTAQFVQRTPAAAGGATAKADPLGIR